LAKTAAEIFERTDGSENTMSQLIAASIGGPHHCIGTAQTVIDIVFHHLHQRCASHGGRLNNSELQAAKEDLSQGLVGMPSFFENIHSQCMAASGATTTMRFSRGKILPSLLLLCSQRAAERVFSLQLSFLADAWLDLFYDGFATFIQNHVNANCELVLGMAYAKAACKFRQSLSTEKYILEQDVQNILRKCALQLKEYETDGGAIAKATDDVNGHIALGAWRLRQHVNTITNRQMQKFFEISGREIAVFIK
jgi:hypothetical protein